MATADLSGFSSYGGAQRDPLWLRVIFTIPLLGWMLRDAMHGSPDAGKWFAFNLVAIAGFAIALIGYPALIFMGLSGTAFMLVMLVLLTRAR